MNIDSRWHRFIAPIVCLTICIAGTLRTGSLLRPAYSVGEPNPATIRTVSHALATNSPELNALLSQSGIDRAERQQFDPTAPIVLAGGADGKPGQAGQDDNFDGVVDNSAELGAVGSDDQCVAPWETNYSAAEQQQSKTIISRGAFVSSDDVDETKPSRFVLTGRHGDTTWTWIVIP